MRESRAPAKVTCAHCGGEEFSDGRLVGYGAWGIRFIPAWKRWFRTGPKVEASVCRNCGRLSLWVAPDDMHRAMGD